MNSTLNFTPNILVKQCSLEKEHRHSRRKNGGRPTMIKSWLDETRVASLETGFNLNETEMIEFMEHVLKF
jgi:hypothetical protein